MEMTRPSGIQTGCGPVSITTANHGSGCGARLGESTSDEVRSRRQYFMFFHRGDNGRSRDHEAEYVPYPSRGVR